MSASPPVPSTGRRVLFVTENMPVPRDVRVQREAAALRDAGWTVSIISPRGAGGQGRFAVVDGIPVYRHPTVEARSPLGYVAEYANALLWELALALRVLRRHGFDVIHAANPPDTLCLVAAVFKPFGKRFVFDQHDLSPELYEVKFGRRGATWRGLRLLERLSFRLADVSIATNESYRRVAIERGHMEPDDVFVVRNGPILGERPQPPAGDLRRGRRHLVVFAGSIGSQDGVDLLIEAARHLVHEERRDVQFVVVGAGGELDRLRQLAVTLDLGDRIEFTGLLPHAELLGVVDAADVCVSPDDKNALNDRCTMVKVLEYMAAAKPVVQFDLHEGRVSAGDAALYATANDPVDLARKIVEVLDDPALAARLGAIGRRRVEESLAWHHQVPALLAAYERLADRRGRRHHRRLHQVGAPA